MGLNHFVAARDALDNYEFEERRGDDLVVKEAIGVSGLITPWNSYKPNIIKISSSICGW